MAASTEAHELSERESEILRLVATGASNKEIAVRLVISPNTVKVHLRNIFAKIGVVSRTEATLYAIQHRLVDAPLGSSQAPADLPAAPAPLSVPAAPTRPVWARLALWFGLLGALALALWAGRVLLERREPLPQSAPALVRWRVEAALPRGRAAAAAVVYENALYLIGGLDEAGPSASVLRQALPQGELRSSASLPSPTAHAQAALLGERIYVPGGMDASGAAAAGLAIYDPRIDAWTEGAVLPEPLYGYAMAALEGRLYLFGGTDGSRYNTDVYIYDPELDAWSAGGPLPQPAAFLAAAPLGAGKILLVGGCSDRGALDAAWIYFPQRDLNGEPAWEAAAPLPEGRCGMGLSALASAVYLVGGASSVDAASPSLPPLQYSPHNDAWTPFEAPPQPAGLYPALLPFETHLHLLGGLVDGRPSADHQSYQAIYTILIPGIQ
jgi:DNA-binding CsgD family transcriptional regulator